MSQIWPNAFFCKCQIVWSWSQNTPPLAINSSSDLKCYKMWWGIQVPSVPMVIKAPQLNFASVNFPQLYFDHTIGVRANPRVIYSRCALRSLLNSGKSQVPYSSVWPICNNMLFFQAIQKIGKIMIEIQQVEIGRHWLSAINKSPLFSPHCAQSNVPGTIPGLKLPGSWGWGGLGERTKLDLLPSVCVCQLLLSTHNLSLSMATALQMQASCKRENIFEVTSRAGLLARKSQFLCRQLAAQLRVSPPPTL